MPVGIIKKMTSRGFGFIETDSEIDYFFHHMDYKGKWKELLTKFVLGDIIHVKFEVDKTNTVGPKAIDVVVTQIVDNPDKTL